MRRAPLDPRNYLRIQLVARLLEIVMGLQIQPEFRTVPEVQA